MNIEIEKPLDLLLEMTYLNGVLKYVKLPDLKNLNTITASLTQYISDQITEGKSCEE